MNRHYLFFKFETIENNKRAQLVIKLRQLCGKMKQNMILWQNTCHLHQLSEINTKTKWSVTQLFYLTCTFMKPFDVKDLLR